MQINFSNCDFIIKDILNIDPSAIPTDQKVYINDLKAFISEPENFHIGNYRFRMLCSKVSRHCKWLAREIQEAAINYLAQDYDIWLIDKEGRL